MNNAQRAEQLASALHDLQALRRVSDPHDEQLLATGLRVLHDAEQAWFAAPNIALMLGDAKRLLLHNALHKVPPGASLHAAMRFIQKWAPRLPDKEKSMLGIANAPAAAETPLTAAGLPRRVEGASRAPAQLRKAAAPIPPEMDQRFAARTVENLERTLKALQKWNVPADGQSPSL